MSYPGDSAHAKILMEGLGGGVCLLAVHWHVQEANRQAYLPRIRATTLNVIGSLIDEGLFELGTMARSARITVPAAVVALLLASCTHDTPKAPAPWDGNDHTTARWIPNPAADLMSPEGPFIRAVVESWGAAQVGQGHGPWMRSKPVGTPALITRSTMSGNPKKSAAPFGFSTRWSAPPTTRSSR